MIIIIDCGSQYSHLIWRNIRDLGYEPKLVNKSASFDEIKDADSYIISGGPSSVYKDDLGIARTLVQKIAKGEIEKPLLGICLGHQLIAYELKGKVEKGSKAEYGLSKIIVDEENTILKGMPKEFNAWVSHFDEVKELPKGFKSLAHSDVCKHEAMMHTKKPIYGVQFHPEVWHTENGEKILENFAKIK